MADYTPHQIDVIKSLFTYKYDKETTLEVLAYLESEKTLVSLIKEYHPKYYIEQSQFTPETVATITLCIDLGYC
jgi:hypothetical protein